jgi:hypothetical protein
VRDELTARLQTARGGHAARDGLTQVVELKRISDWRIDYAFGAKPYKLELVQHIKN